MSNHNHPEHAQLECSCMYYVQVFAVRNLCLWIFLQQLYHLCLSLLLTRSTCPACEVFGGTTAKPICLYPHTEQQQVHLHFWQSLEQQKLSLHQHHCVPG